MTKRAEDRMTPADVAALLGLAEATLALGDTQQAFAHRLGLAISTVVRYERSRPPSGRALARLLILAYEKGHEGIAAEMRAALECEIGLWIAWPPRAKSEPTGADKGLEVGAKPKPAGASRRQRKDMRNE